MFFINHTGIRRFPRVFPGSPGGGPGGSLMMLVDDAIGIEDVMSPVEAGGRVVHHSDHQDWDAS